MLKPQFDFLVVGAGFAGSVMASEIARKWNKTVLVVDKRNHIGGNAYDTLDAAGIRIHPYGPHIFHTNSNSVFDYLSQYTQWRQYEHRVLTKVNGILVPIPINLDTVNLLYNLNLDGDQLEAYFESVAEKRERVVTSEDVVVSKVGRDLYEKLFRGYTRKQWGLDPSELDSSVISRIPVRTNRDDRYFTDQYQAMPLHGYSRMFENMLDHPNIHISLRTSYRDVMSEARYHQLVFTGPVDEFFDYRFGKLPYRSLLFEHETCKMAQFQSVAVVNYPNEELFTRITEFKQLTGQVHRQTSIVREYPTDQGDPYYPIPRPANSELYKKYEGLAKAEANVHFAGRLATYKYYNMDQVVGQALMLSSKIVSGEKPTYENGDLARPDTPSRSAGGPLLS